VTRKSRIGWKVRVRRGERTKLPGHLQDLDIVASLESGTTLFWSRERGHTWTPSGFDKYYDNEYFYAGPDFPEHGVKGIELDTLPDDFDDIQEQQSLLKLIWSTFVTSWRRRSFWEHAMVIVVLTIIGIIFGWFFELQIVNAMITTVMGWLF